MSDHMDSPGADANPRCDIGEIFAFRGETGLCLIMSLNPLSDPNLTDTLRLAPGCVYEFKIDLDGDAIPDLSHKIVVAGSRPRQQITLLRATGEEARRFDGSGEIVVTGFTSVGAAVEVHRGANGEALYAGPRQDPFFFNFVGVDSPLADPFRAAISEDGLPNEGSSDDTFRATNITAICIEVPIEHDRFTVWGVTTLEGHRIDRAGRPSISAIFLPNPPFGDLRDAFNDSNPDEDRSRFGQAFLATLDRYAADPALVDHYLPDVLPVDMTKPTTYPNGRGLTEDPATLARSSRSNRRPITEAICASGLAGPSR